MPEPVSPRWSGTVIVAASGPSLTAEVADACRGHSCLAINDAYKQMPWAEVLYAADWKWWQVHRDCDGFAGERWAPYRADSTSTESKRVFKELDLRLVEGEFLNTFSFDPKRIHLGAHGCANSGFQGINLALLMGGNPVVLVGYDMRAVDGRKHFFGDHPQTLNKRQNFPGWITGITKAASQLPEHVKILNATPNSALSCFPSVTLKEALGQ